MADTGEMCHYLEAAPNDMDGGMLDWTSPAYVRTIFNGTGTQIGTGRNNTALILAVDVDAPAAKACKRYNNGGKTDWFLPSKDELNMLYLARDCVGNMRTDWPYWSSSAELPRYPGDISGLAWLQRFDDSSKSGTGSYEYSAGYVRAVRAF